MFFLIPTPSTLNPSPEQPISAQEAMSRPLIVVLVVIAQVVVTSKRCRQIMIRPNSPR